MFQDVARNKQIGRDGANLRSVGHRHVEFTPYDSHLRPPISIKTDFSDAGRQEHRRSKFRVLLVEDHPQVRAAARRYLEFFGHEAIVAESGEHALALEEEIGLVDLVLTDVVMPGISGFQLADRLQQIRPALPVLFMSGHPQENIPDQWREQLVVKPFALDELREKIEEALGVPSSV